MPHQLWIRVLVAHHGGARLLQGASCLDWGPWAAPVPGWDCCWAPPRALDSCVLFTASGGNGPGTMTRASLCPTPWTTHRLQSPDARVGAGPLRPQSWLTMGQGSRLPLAITCGTGQWMRGPESFTFLESLLERKAVSLFCTLFCRRVY